MNLQQARHNAIAATLVIATAFLLGNPSFADPPIFRVAFERIAGVESGMGILTSAFG